MLFWDWVIMIVPIIFIMFLAFYSNKYIRSVADYVVAGRVAGRYILTNGGAMASLSIISLVALVEAKYKVGYGVAFWENVMIPVALFLSLTGYINYRYRRTNSMSQGQFLEMRYSKRLRIIASFLRILAEMLVNAIGPAIAANFFIYILDLPHKINVFGYTMQTYTLVVVVVLALALLIVWKGGLIALLITDSIQGIISFPIFIIIAGFLLYKINWGDCISPVLTDRVPGESFVNPFDVHHLRDFNLFAVIVALCGGILCKGVYIGNDGTSCGRTPHEQKMATILGSWRVAVTTLVQIVLVVSIIGLMNHESWSPQAHKIRQALSSKVIDEVIINEELRSSALDSINSIPISNHKIGESKPLSQKKNIDTPYHQAIKESVGNSPEGNLIYQKFKTMYNQMLMPISMRQTLPSGLIGLFCLLMIMLLLSTDDTRIMNASNAIVQDLVVPFRKNEMSPKKHLMCLRFTALFVALFFLVCSLLFAQMDYITLFLSALIGIWSGGAGPIITFGLYSKFGNTYGAYASLILGSGNSIIGLFLQRNWATLIYPFLEKHDLVNSVNNFLVTVSSPFNPYILWEMNPIKFPINSYEIYFISMIVGTIGYVSVSLLTQKKPFNLDKMLYLGKYSPDGYVIPRFQWGFKNIVTKLLGITPEYTKGDKILTWSVLLWTLGFKFGICFLGVLVWNIFFPWREEAWGIYFFVYYIGISFVLAVISMLWFGIGGVRDCFQLFKDLDKRVANPLDNGRVENRIELNTKQNEHK